MNIIFFIRFSRLYKCNRGISFSALQKAPLWNWQTREVGPVSWWFQVLDENSQPDQIQCGCSHQEKGMSDLTNCLTWLTAILKLTHYSTLLFLHFVLWGSFRLLLSLFCHLIILSCPPAQSSIPLHSRSKRTKRKNASRGGSSTSCTKYSWTQTPSTIAWPMTWQTVCSVRETWRSVT